MGEGLNLPEEEIREQWSVRNHGSVAVAATAAVSRYREFDILDARAEPFSLPE